MKDNSQYFNDNLTLLRSKTCWEHCFSFLHKSHNQVEYTSGVFHNLLGNLCNNPSTEMIVFFVQVILYCLVDLIKAFLSIKLGKKTQTHEKPLFISLPRLPNFLYFNYLHTSDIFLQGSGSCWPRIGNRGFEGRQVLAGLSWLGGAGRDTEEHKPDADSIVSTVSSATDYDSIVAFMTEFLDQLVLQ